MSRIWTPSRKIITPRRLQKGNFAMFPAGTAAAAAAGGDVITLSGTSGAPNQRTADAISPNDAHVTWRWNTDGTLEVRNGEVVAAWSDFNSGTEWCNQPPVGEYWIRFQNDAGDNPTSGSDPLNTWLKIGGSGAAARLVEWRENTNGFASTQGTVQVDIATDSSGTNIVATGYYRGSAVVEL